ncbi:thiamine ABC transporter ATP-binding protein [Photobacterium sp. 1_MG-2023]|uniref:thiamine ABC transporter ATP-binding protein n=1 Tax=Photobacterium sp. 1_MG-2023 TaxID=3062646 RepID=UPI0026E2BD18|nr:thiamine ABC transporter ATP-binding protein [Photobacterium sp. 1_MG-2023]MDO6707627.1 thiamine ABC transporter ATP-binding protein [Photobacterium sp. 1_MG-2023]
MLSLSQLSHCYRHGNQEPMTLCFDLEVSQGEILAVIGPSGAGKSTLLAMIAGFLKPDSGTLHINGQPIHQQSPADRPLSILFQDHNLFPHLSVFDNIALGIHPGLKLSPTDKAQVTAAAERVGIAQYLTRLPEQLSGGQKQRVALARCLVRHRPLLLLDEPFSALDPALRQDMLTQVASLAREDGITVLMITHSPEDAVKIADHCAFVDEGRIEVCGPTRQVLGEASNERLKQYLGR